MSKPDDNSSLPEWADGKNATVIWRYERIITQSTAIEVKVIEPESSYIDPESEVPISGECLIKKLMKSHTWICMGVFLVNDVKDGLPCHKIKAVLTRL